ncbi:MAG: hypothetical protein OCU17_00510 [Methanophagales archaeon]|nr:hypothetical protein [Methanophagales archaeon]
MGNKIAYILLGLAVLSIFQTVVIAQPVIEQGPLLTPQLIEISPQVSAIEYIIADHSHHHLGDDFKENLIPKEPEGVVYTKTFFMDSEFESPELILMIKSVVPVAPHEINDSTEYLDKVYINDVEVGILNFYATPEHEPADVYISVDPGLLRIGNNTIKITSGSNRDGSNYDDFEFFGLILKGIRKTGWMLSGRVTYNHKPAFAWIDVYHNETENKEWARLVSSFGSNEDGTYSIKLPNGVYDITASTVGASDTKTTAINNSNVSLDFNLEYTYTPPPAEEIIFRDDSHHHLGDDFKENLIPKEPEGLVYTKTFFMNSEFESPELILMIKSVVPDALYEINDSTEYLDKIYINDVEVGILNLHVIPELETSEFWTLLDPNPLRIGDNTIKITSGSNRDGSNYDDFEFFNLELKGIRKTGWVLSGRVEIDNEPANAYVCVYRHGTDELVSSCLTDNNGSYSLKLPNGVYDVKATSNTGFFNPQSATKTLVINNSNVTLDLKTSMFGFFLFIFFIFFILPSSITGLIIAIVVYAFTKNRKLTVIGFVSGMVTACVSNMWLIDVIEERSLPLSAGIAFIIVAVPIILLSKRKSKVEGGGEL